MNRAAYSDRIWGWKLVRVSEFPTLIRFVLLLSCGLLAGAARPAPEVSGEDSAAVRSVHRALKDLSATEVDGWVRRAWSTLEAEGWPRARLRVDTLESREAWRLQIESGPRTRLSSLEARGSDIELAGTWKDASGLVTGRPLSPGIFETALQLGLRALSESGYPLASVTVLDQTYDAEHGAVDIVVLVRAGPRARIREILVHGATRTRPEVIVRLSGLKPGQWVLESSLELARQRLLARPGLVDDVSEMEVLRVPGVTDAVDVRFTVDQNPASGSFSGALGARKGVDGKTELSGAVELLLRDLFGTARSFRGQWQDDGRGRSQLHLSWLEPMIFKSGFDLSLAIGQRHEDSSYDMVLGEFGLFLPARPGLQIGVTAGLDRTTFLGDSGRSRRRNRVGVVLGMQWARGRGAGPFGNFGTDFQAAFVSDRRKDPDGDGSGSVEASVRHSLIQANGRAGWAFTRVIAIESRLGWRSTENAPLPLPRSEQWAVGGATTVRGHAEQRYFGERVAWGGLEAVFGPPRRGQAYLFFDYGWVRTTSEEADVKRVDEHLLSGFGLGVRAPTTLGAIDLSLGFADELNFDEGKLHVALVQHF
jgi:outer membrane protein assembly factor BamA